MQVMSLPSLKVYSSHPVRILLCCSFFQKLISSSSNVQSHKRTQLLKVGDIWVVQKHLIKKIDCFVFISISFLSLSILSFLMVSIPFKHNQMNFIIIIFGQKLEQIKLKKLAVIRSLLIHGQSPIFSLLLTDIFSHIKQIWQLLVF